MFGRKDSKKNKDKKEKSAKKENELSFLGHLEELRRRLWFAAIAMVLGAIVVFIFTDWLMDNVILALKDSNFITYQLFGRAVDYLELGDNYYAQDIVFQTHSNTMTGQFGMHIFMSIVGGIIGTFPFIAYQLWKFVKPGLRDNERKATVGVVFYITLLFFLGVLFGYYLVTPLTVQFFGQYQLHNDVDIYITINSYMSTVVSTTFASGLFFLLPVVIWVLAKIGIVSASLLKKYRKHAVVGLLVLSAIITPPDVISQILVVLPLMVLYEISILIARRIEKKRLKEA